MRLLSPKRTRSAKCSRSSVRNDTGINFFTYLLGLFEECLNHAIALRGYLDIPAPKVHVNVSSVKNLQSHHQKLLKKMKCVRVLKYPHSIMSIAGSTLVSGGRDNEIRIWQN